MYKRQGYSYIKVTKDEWPRLSFTLQKEDDGAEYIGPYTSVSYTHLISPSATLRW